MKLREMGDFLCIDLEANCWRKGEKQHRMEIIEIGTVLYRPGTGVIGELPQFVRPVGTPTLSPFCMGITSITQEDVDRADTFPVALQRLLEFPERETVFTSWGDFDRRQFDKDCSLHKLEYPFPAHLNLKRLFGARTGKGLLDLEVAMRECGTVFQGRPHRGIDDARNLARVLDWMILHET